MNELLGEILEAHGSLERWNQYQKVEATIVSGEGLFALKGVPQDSSPRRMHDASAVNFLGYSESE